MKPKALACLCLLFLLNQEVFVWKFEHYNPDVVREIEPQT